MNTLATLTLSAAAALSVVAFPLAAQEIVVSPTAHDAFVADVSADLDGQLDRIWFGSRWEPSGIVQVRFRAGADGRPEAVTTYRSSGDGRFDRAAVRAVEGLTSLSPLAQSALPGRTIQANIIVARSASEFDRLSLRLAREEAARIESSPRERFVLALTTASRPAS